MVTEDISAVVDAAEDYKNGVLPVAGGTLDQAASAMHAIRQVRREKAKYEP